MRIWFLFVLMTHFTLVNSQEIDTIYYQNGAIKAYGELDKDGKMISEWIYLYPSGVVSAKLFYNKEESLSGSQFMYDYEGHLIAHERWENDMLQDSSIYFFSNGQIEKAGIFEDGLYFGEWVFYHENGNLRQVGSYLDGVPNGLWEFYFENGQLNQRGAMRDGKENGSWEYFDEDGNPTYQGSWSNGEKTGQWYFYKKGKKKPWKKFD